jgi:hypothetical protein
MEARTVSREATPIAQYKLRIIHLQERAAELARKGEAEAARRERAKLLKSLHELDVMEVLRMEHAA